METSESIKKTLLGKGDPFTDILGQENIKKGLRSAMLMNRHVLIIGPPGIGKTTLAKNIAQLLPELELNNCAYHCNPKDPICPECRAGKSKKAKINGSLRFIRVQGSPDLTAEDLIGDIDPVKALKYGPLSMEAFTPGKIFKANNGILFFDELNRCPEKLQNALLQVLEERKATIGSYDIDLKTNFIFIGTMNPQDTSTEKLSDVLLDRFDVFYMDYPETKEIEKKIVVEKGRKESVDFPDNLLDLTTVFVRMLRDNDKLDKKPSVRAVLGLYERAQANALLEGKNKVEFKHIRESIISVLSHRITLKPSVQYLQSPSELLKEELQKFIRDYKISESEGEGP